MIGAALQILLPLIVEDGAGFLLNYMDLRPRWRVYRVEFPDLSELLASLLRAAWQGKIQHYPFYNLLCNEAFSNICDVLLLGATSIGVTGMMWPIVSEAIIRIRNNGDDGAAIFVNNPMMVWSFAVFLSSGVYMYRISILIGSHYVENKV